MSLGERCPSSTDNKDEVVEVGHAFVKAAPAGCPCAEWDISICFLCTNPDFFALGKHAEGGREVGWASTQQCTSKSQGHFYPAILSSALATQNECELWGPTEPLISLSCHPSSHFPGN